MDRKEEILINRIKAERELSQQKEVINGTKDKHTTLSDLLNIAGAVEPGNIRALYSEKEIGGIRSIQKETALGAYDIITPFLNGDCSHITLHARIWEEDSFITCYIHLTCPWYEMGNEDAWLGIRSQMMWVNNEHEVYNSKHIIIYDENDEKIWLDRINTCIENGIEKLNKGEALTNAEETALDRKSISVNEINSAIEEERYTDALCGLHYHYDNLRNLIHKANDNDKKAKEAFEVICNKMGQCYAQKGLFKQASIFYHKLNNPYDKSVSLLPIMSATNDPLYETEYQETLTYINHFQSSSLNQKDIDFAEMWRKKVEQTKRTKGTESYCFRRASRIGIMLETIFGITPQEISNMKVVNEEGTEMEMIQSSYDIMDYDFIKAMNGKSHLSAYVNYRSEYDEIDTETLSEDERNITANVYNGGEDKSTQCTQNSIIISFDRQKIEGKEVIKVSMMVPTFTLAPISWNDYYPSTVGLAFSEKAGISEDFYAQERNKAYEKLYYKQEMTRDEYMLSGVLTKGKEHFLSMNRSAKASVWGDVLYYGTLAYESMSKEYAETNSKNAKEPDEMCMISACFTLGFAYNEYKSFSMASYYLRNEKKFNDKNLSMEYINTLSNSSDANLEEYLKNEYAMISEQDGKYEKWSDEDKHGYLQFLDRRVAYLYVEQKKWDEAKEILQDLLNDPESAEYAQQELSYIEEQMKQEE